MIARLHQKDGITIRTIEGMSRPQDQARSHNINVSRVLCILKNDTKDINCEVNEEWADRSICLTPWPLWNYNFLFKISGANLV
jgi:hypothetical protein